VNQAGPKEAQGSFGNGGAMRVAPLGGYFADDMGRLVAEAAASSEVTHAHPDGIAGAVAVAAAAAGAWRIRTGQLKRSPLALLECALEHTPAGLTQERMERARSLPADTTAWQAAQVLGNGEPITSVETVPSWAASWPWQPARSRRTGCNPGKDFLWLLPLPAEWALEESRQPAHSPCPVPFVRLSSRWT
jgi:ADP-ribosylglycohydrolase